MTTELGGEAADVASTASKAWEMPGSHLDHCIPNDGFLTFPRCVFLRQSSAAALHLAIWTSVRLKTVLLCVAVFVFWTCLMIGACVLHSICIRPVRLSTMTYLTECAPGEPAAHGGSTVVWPGSSRKFERLAATDPERFKMMIALGEAREEAGVGVDGAEAPIELRHKQGDVSGPFLIIS